MKSLQKMIKVLVVIMASLAMPSVSNAVTASNGEVFLQGNFVEVGIHNSFSFGTTGCGPAGFHARGGSGGCRLGFVADHGRDGWNVGIPGFSGDYFVPGSPEEGWSLSWKVGGSQRTKGNFGLNGYFQIPKTSLIETSSGTTNSASWEGTASNGVSERLRISHTVSFGDNDLYFTINTVITNVGTSTVDSLVYMRNVDPDQEQPWTGNYTTRNWVESQPPRAAFGAKVALAARPAGNTREALAIAEGLTYGLTLGLGAIDSRAVVAASHGFANRNPQDALNNPNQPVQNGGATRPGMTGSVADQAILITFDLGSLAPGQSTSFDYAYILNRADLSVALGNLAAVTILQPTGTVSGAGVIFQATTDDVPNTTKMDFYVNGALVGTDTTPDLSGVFEITFDSTVYPNGGLPLKAVATFTGSRIVEKLTSVNVDNSGPPMSFATPLAGLTFSTGTAIPIEVVIDPSQPPVRVSFFREAAGAPSMFLGEDTTAPFTSSFAVSDLPEGTTVVIKAVGTDALGRVTTIQTSGVTSSDAIPVIRKVPADIQVNQHGILTPVNLPWGLFAYDQEDGMLRARRDYRNGGFPVGTTVVTYSVTDSFGHTVSASVNVRVLAPGDTWVRSSIVTPPTPLLDTAAPVLLRVPADVTVMATGVGTPVGLPWGLSAYDDRDGFLRARRDVRLSYFPVGTTVVTYSVSDAAGNTATAVVNVTVIAPWTPPL